MTARVHLRRDSGHVTLCGLWGDSVATATDPAAITCSRCRTSGHLDPAPTRAEALEALRVARRDVRNYHGWAESERARINALRREAAQREADMIAAERRAYSRLDRAERRAIRAGVNLAIEVQS